jgi:hypothetical protein
VRQKAVKDECGITAKALMTVMTGVVQWQTIQSTYRFRKFAVLQKIFLGIELP